MRARGGSRDGDVEMIGKGEKVGCGETAGKSSVQFI